MTSFVRVFVVVLFAVAAVAGQITTTKDDILEGQYMMAEFKASELIKKANYRSVWTKEYFANRSKDVTLHEKLLREVLQPDKWHTIEEKFGDKLQREEMIADGKAFYFRTNDGPWAKGGLGSGSGVMVESEQVKDQFRYIPALDFEGTKADLYELVSVRKANKYSQTDLVDVKYVTTVRIWYSTDGKILKKIEEKVIEGREEMLRETTTYEYDPKDLKIEAPAIK